MRAIEMLDDQEREAGVVRSRFEERRERLEAAGGRADADDRGCLGLDLGRGRRTLVVHRRNPGKDCT
jgi:hypothetical protein